jgi:methionyl-tRNA formyltransferase
LTVERKLELRVFSSTKKIDAGNILVRKRHPLCVEHNVLNFIEDVYVAATWEVMRETVSLLESGSEGAVIDVGSGFYRKRRRPEDGEIRFDTDVSSLCRFVRAQSYPFPGAYIRVKEQKLIVLDARPMSLGTERSAGEVISVGQHHVDVSCANGVVRLKGLQNCRPADFRPGQALR